MKQQVKGTAGEAWHHITGVKSIDFEPGEPFPKKGTEVLVSWDDGKCYVCQWWKRQRDGGKLSEDYFFCPNCGKEL